MPYKLKLKLQNPGSQPVKTIIYGGTVFEVQDPFSGRQNLAATGNTQVILPPQSAQVVVIDTWCLNSSFAPPNNTPMGLTAFAIPSKLGSQGDVWSYMSQHS
ncbi:MAG TPA: hypothetical protein VGG03_06405 [Thermoanaerobaculia bacterium]|jgi:hypothetical protein